MENKKQPRLISIHGRKWRARPRNLRVDAPAAIEAVIESAPEGNRERLRRLQWRIDQERRLARTPMAACLRISRMMWRAVLGPGGLNDRFVELQTRFNGHARCRTWMRRWPRRCSRSRAPASDAAAACIRSALS